MSLGRGLLRLGRVKLTAANQQQVSTYLATESTSCKVCKGTAIYLCQCGSVVEGICDLMKFDESGSSGFQRSEASLLMDESVPLELQRLRN